VRARRSPVHIAPNLFAEQAIYMTSKKSLTDRTTIGSNKRALGD